MCGVYLRISKNNEVWLDDFDAKNIRQIIKRGPDGVSLQKFSDSKVVYGFTRLAIRALQNGDQPFIEGRFISAFNGEVYNCEYLIKQIISKFPTEIIPESDTKILGLWLYLFGPDSINEVTGMFAGYIHIGSKIYGFTDRVGEKPLYYGFFEDVFFVSSNLPEFVDRSELISDYTLLTGLIKPQISNEVFMLTPGTFFEIDESLIGKKSEVKIVKYWKWPNRPKFFSEQKKGNFEVILTDSVKSQLVSDVGMSVLLSGGVDSGVIAAIARREFGSTLTSFTLSFKDSKYSEKSNAVTTAKHLDLRHEIIEVSFEDLANNLNSTLDAMDIPIFDSGALSLFSLCKEVSKANKVSLTGDGGDELFRGYSIFDYSFIINLLSVIPSRLPLSIVLKNLNKFQSQNENYLGFELKISRALSSVYKREINPLYGALGPFGGSNLFTYICDQVKDKEFAAEKKFISKKNIEAYFIEEILPKIYLIKSDRISMYHGLELRSPFLDYRVIEAAFRFSEWNLNFNPRKEILKQVAFNLLPKEILNSKKHGFSAPFHNVVKYLDKPDWTSPRDEKELSLFNKIWSDALEGKESAGTPAWNILVREYFYKKAMKY
jgi:asparagine synthase (glutamine-hydrolysing)